MIKKFFNYSFNIVFVLLSLLIFGIAFVCGTKSVVKYGVLLFIPEVIASLLFVKHFNPKKTKTYTALWIAARVIAGIVMIVMTIGLVVSIGHTWDWGSNYRIYVSIFYRQRDQKAVIFCAVPEQYGVVFHAVRGGAHI